ncbi:uncharacterized protein LOC144162208 [Haemaphysalis longicornis]
MSLAVHNDCNLFSQVLKDSLNASLDPCHDFYEYVCSRRDRGHIGPFKELVYSEFIRSVSDKNEFTSAPPEGQSAVQKAAMFHKSCLDVYTGNGSELEALKRALTECGVFWPKLSNESNLLAMTFALSATYAWAPVLVFLPRRAGHVIVSPSRSFQSRQSRRQAMLEFSRGRYVEYWRFMVDTIGPGNEIEVLPYEELVQLESKVSPALRDAYAAASIVKIENASLSDVVKLAGNAFSRSAWEKELLEHINFPGINSSTPYVFDIMNVRFFDAFFHLVGEVGEDRMAYYVGWAAAQDLSLLSNARLIRQKYLMDADASRGHATFCANFSNYYMGLAFYADYIRSAYLGSYLPRAVGIVKGVREHFGQGFSSSTAWKTLTLRGYMQSLSEDSAATNDPLEFLSVAREERLNVLYEHFPNMISDIFENVKRAAMGHRETAADMAMPRFVQNGRVRFHYLNKDGRPKLLPVVLEPTFFSPDAPPGIKYATLGGEVADAFSSAVFRRLSGDHDDAATTAVVSDLLCLKDTRVDAGMVSPFPALSGSSVQLKLAKKLVSLDALFGAFLDDTGGEQQLRLAEYSTLTGRQTLFAFWCLMQCGVPDGKRGCNVPLRLFQPFAAAFECREGGAMSTPRHCG